MNYVTYSYASAGVATANCNVNAIFLLRITLFGGVFYILSAFSIESSGKKLAFILQFAVLELEGLGVVVPTLVDRA